MQSIVNTGIGDHVLQVFNQLFLGLSFSFVLEMIELLFLLIITEFCVVTHYYSVIGTIYLFTYLLDIV